MRLKDESQLTALENLKPVKTGPVSPSKRPKSVVCVVGTASSFFEDLAEEKAKEGQKK